VNVLLAASGWHLIPSFTVVGLVLGGTYALAAIGLVLIYRVSGVLNFAHGAVAMFSTFIAFQLSVKWGYPGIVGLLGAVVVGAFIGLLIDVGTMRPLTGRPALTKVVVTIGWLLVLQTTAGQIWGDTAYHRPVKLVSSSGFRLIGTNLIIGYDQLVTLVVAVALALGTAAVLRWTILGVSLRAVADDPRSARLWGINVNVATATSWMAGSAMAAIAGVLVTPRINFTTFSLTIIVIDAFAAALIGRLTSLPWAVVGAMFLGLVQTWPTAFFHSSGVAELFTFGLVMATLLILFRGRIGRLRAA